MRLEYRVNVEGETENVKEFLNQWIM